jgi:dephospho-CoA kinase
MNPLFVVVGMPGAGKTTVVKYLGKSGWPVVYFGKITLDEIRQRGMLPSEESEREVRESMRKTYGNAVYAARSLRHIEQCLQRTPTIVDGLYSWDEYKFLTTHIKNPIQVIAVCAERRIRYARLAKRPKRPLTLVEAEKRDFAEIENIQKGGPIAIADHTLLNNDSESSLEAAVGRLVLAIMGSTTPGERG